MIRGPRQIGKSTLLKYTIFDLLKKGNRRSICYLPLDTTKDYTELRDNTAFREYFETTMHEIPRFSLNEILEFGESEKLELDLLIPDIEKSFHEYLESGGIPSVIETVKKGGNFGSLLDSGWDTMIGDVEKEGLSRSKLMGVLGYTGQRLSQRFSWTSAASEIEVDTKTFQSYIDTLGHNYMAMTLKAVDRNSLLPMEKKQKKVYFYDNFVLKNIERKFGIVQNQPNLVESAVAQNLVFRFSDWLEEGLSSLQNVGYWYSSDGKEIDFIVGGIPVELKYQNSVNRSDLAAVKKVFGKGIVLSKDTLDLSGDVKIIPSHLFWGII